jgi:serine/threonine protein kinase
VDVYALAAVAFEMLSGRKAISGKTAMEVAQRVVAQPPPDLTEFVPGTPDAAAAAICRGLAKDPGERPASAGELVRELTQAYAEPVTKRPEPPPTAPPAPPLHQRRRPVWILPVVVAALAALVVIAALSSGGGSDKPGPTTSTDKAAGGARSQSSTPSEAPSGGANSQGAAANPAPAPAATPEAALQAFYTRAANDRFDDAWSLASPRLRQQLGGYDSFKGTFSTLESIEISKVKAKGKSGKVSFESVATHTDHVDRCKGSADTVKSSESWLLDHIEVNCKRG